MRPQRPPLAIRIDVVSIEGLALSAAESRRLHAALEAELTRLASAAAVSARWNDGATPSVLAPAVAFARPMQPEHLGTAIGRSVWTAIGGER
jgi:hypothetical protein